jgi:hypothetical protein
MHQLKLKNSLFLLILCGVVSISVFSETLQNNTPSGLTVNFLAHTSQVYQNGYPVNVPMEQAILQADKFQFTEIAQKQPFFGWIVNSEKNNTMQTAYQILVASSLENISKNIGDCWDSGKTTSAQSINITYSGKELKPNSIYYWKVKTWDNHGIESSFSALSRFKSAAELFDYATARYPQQKTDIYPQAIKSISATSCLIDFGKDAFAQLRLTLNGKTDADTVLVHLGEALKDGRINRAPGGTIRYSVYKLALKAGTNTYQIILNPDKRNTGPQAILLPDFIGEVTPFRYCEIEGYDGKITREQAVQQVVSYPFDETESYFTSSDTVLNQVWDLCKYSMKTTSFLGIFVDGDRERIPYEADAYINQLGYYNVVRDYSIGRYSHEYLITHPTWPTEWILQSVLMAWNDYLYTGNTELLERFYPNLKAKALLPLADATGLISTRTNKVTQEVLKSVNFNGTLKDIVDWPQSGILGLGKKEPGETDGFIFRDFNTVVNAYHYQAVTRLAQIAKTLNQPADEKQFTSRAQKLRKVFNEKFFNQKAGYYIDGIGTDHASLHANMFPMAFGLVPENQHEKVSKWIESRGLACSVYGSQFLMDAVYEGGNAQYGLQLLSSTAERSWYNMIRAGATISMEAWDNKYKPNQDWNHAWGAVPANIIPAKLMGIEPLEPGFGKIRIKPQPGNLESAEIKTPTIRGEVLLSFRNKPKQSFSMHLTIPANTTANVYLPFWSKTQKVIMNGKPVKTHQDGSFVIVDEVVSGSSKFEVVTE